MQETLVVYVIFGFCWYAREFTILSASVCTVHVYTSEEDLLFTGRHVEKSFFCTLLNMIASFLFDTG